MNHTKTTLFAKSIAIASVGFCVGILMWWLYLSLVPTKLAPPTLTPKAISLLSDISAKSRIGDIIFRKGTNTESALISSISKSPFSHIGIIVSLEPLLIVHATTDDNPQKQNQVIISSGNEFLSQALSIGIKRTPLQAQAQNLIATYALRQVGKKFILNGDKNALYCTTLVRDAIGFASPSFAQTYAYPQANFTFLGVAYILPSVFWDDERLENVLELTTIE